MSRRRMGIITLDPSVPPIVPQSYDHVVIEEIDGLIRVFNDRQVERSQIVPCVTSVLAPELGVTSTDIVIDKFTDIRARFYVPKCQSKLPIIVYFHGGGFCVGSAAWRCYHDFLAKLSAKSNCIIMSVNYRLAPENPLPAAYDDGFRSLMWLKQQAINGCSEFGYLSQCNFSAMFLAGDSAGANIAHTVSIRMAKSSLRPLELKGNILIQPFFGGEERTHSEKYMAQPATSALTLAASDTYWRLALPAGSNRDHPWCNPIVTGSSKVRVVDSLVCVSELDILKDRNLEFCEELVRAGNRVECFVCKGFGHAFQILNKSQLSQIRRNEMISHIQTFIYA